MPKLLSIIIIILSIAALLHIFHIQFNYTPSMPIGFYRQVMSREIKRGDLVSVCLPKKIAVVALQLGYVVVPEKGIKN